MPTHSQCATCKEQRQICDVCKPAQLEVDSGVQVAERFLSPASSTLDDPPGKKAHNGEEGDKGVDSGSGGKGGASSETILIHYENSEGQTLFFFGICQNSFNW